MKNRWTQIRSSGIFLVGLLVISTSANAGSFRDFILEEETSAIQHQATLPGNSQSAACMQCHNGSKAQGITTKHADSTMVFSSHGSTNHPVGMSYARYARNNPASYVATANLDSRIKLENGQVTCVSCHSTKSHISDVAMSSASQAQTEKCSSTKTLTTGQGQTRLCMSCHAM